MKSVGDAMVLLAGIALHPRTNWVVVHRLAPETYDVTVRVTSGGVRSNFTDAGGTLYETLMRVLGRIDAAYVSQDVRVERPVEPVEWAVFVALERVVMHDSFGYLTIYGGDDAANARDVHLLCSGGLITRRGSSMMENLQGAVVEASARLSFERR